MNPATNSVRARNTPRARVFTREQEPILPADLADALTDRGFVPGFTDPDGTQAALSEAGLADARFAIDGAGFRLLSMSSSRGDGCVVTVHATDATQLPDDYLARRAVPKPRLVYVLEAGGPSNSDRNLTENIAEAIMVLTNGAVEIAGLGTKGNKPVIHTTRWLGTIRG